MGFNEIFNLFAFVPFAGHLHDDRAAKYDQAHNDCNYERFHFTLTNFWEVTLH